MTRLICRTIGHCLSFRAELTPNHTGVSCIDQTFSWKEMDMITDGLAASYLNLGIAKKDHVAIWGVNSPSWILCFYALLKIGAIPVPVNTCYKKQELEGLLRRMDVNYLFYGTGVREVHYPDILQTISFRDLPVFKQKFPLEQRIESLTKKNKMSLDQAKKQVNPMDTACILPTSGTTSTAKGVMLSHYSLVNNALEISKQMHWTEADRFCLSVPLFHCFGITAGILAALMTGASVQVLKYYKTMDVMEQVERYGCTILNGVPTMFLAISRNEKKSMYDLSSLKSGIVAGSPISKQEYAYICDSLKMDKLQVSYGQTEASPCISISDYYDSFQKKALTAGKVIPNIEVRVSELSGEILTRGYHVMQGYYSSDEDTKATLDLEGWLHTGDLGFLDSDGYLTITGRRKEMIIRGGENISPLEIETCILGMKEIQQVSVLGIQSDVLQEEIAACIIPKENTRVTKEQVQMYVKKHLANYKVPRYVLEFSTFPVGETGKVQVEVLRKQVMNQITGK